MTRRSLRRFTKTRPFVGVTSLLLLFACKSVSLHDDYGPLELAVREAACDECDDGRCEALNDELWVDASSEETCVASAIFAFDPAYEHANCRFGALEQLLDCLQRRSCGDPREECVLAFRDDARTCERTRADVLGRLAVELCRAPESDVAIVAEYHSAVADGLAARCEVARRCETSFTEFRNCLSFPVSAESAYYARCAAPGWRLYARCIRENGSTTTCEHILDAANSCQAGNVYTAQVNRCLNYIR